MRLAFGAARSCFELVESVRNCAFEVFAQHDLTERRVSGFTRGDAAAAFLARFFFRKAGDAAVSALDVRRCKTTLGACHAMYRHAQTMRGVDDSSATIKPRCARTFVTFLYQICDSRSRVRGVAGIRGRNCGL
ncbi:MAG: hypothetical protein BroJett013_27180 [Alphaproteobacteria bacterium]|nr:MAG: hypothetical protein BroJett013_27180 [Alphaproteobacteria bacterium]